MNSILFRFFLIFITICISSCKHPALGPIKGILVVVSPGMMEKDTELILNNVQRYVESTDREEVFSFSFIEMDEFEKDWKLRRTILFLAETEEDFPCKLESSESGVYHGRNIFANNQLIFGIDEENELDPTSPVLTALADSLEKAYNSHLRNYIYGSFVTTQMSSPERLDSLNSTGFTIDIPKSYCTAMWLPEDGFIQYQRELSTESLLLMLSLRWVDLDRDLTAEESIIWRQAMSRRFFYDAAEDSVDLAKTIVEPLVLHGMNGWRIIGVWRNPEHLNAGAFTSYVLFDSTRGKKYLIDFEIYHPHAPKETYLREGWIIMSSFVPGGTDG